MIRVAPFAVLGVLAVGSEAISAGSALNADDRSLLASYARDTWRSVEKISSFGPLPADGIWRAGTDWTPTNYTSPTNIAAYLWSTISAEGLGLITHEECGRRLSASLGSIGRLERSHGFFYNWYDPRTGDRLRSWPGGGPLRGFLSTVDNGWLAAALMMVGRVRPELKNSADALLGPMNFGFFYDPLDPADPVAHPGLLRGGYYTDGGGVFADYHYGMLNTEPRIASYIGIARGDLPAEHYYRMFRSAPDPSAPSRVYRGVSVAEGSKPYRRARIVPSWDGTMFEALMVPLFVPEAAWAPSSWGANHRLYVRAQMEYGLSDAKLGYWGISASADCRGGYHAFGVGPLGLSPEAGRGLDGSPARVVTPHASFLAMPYAPREAMDNLKALTASYPVYSPYGFLDAVDVGSGRVADCVLVLDQGMILASIANTLGNDILQQAFSTGMIEAAIRPLIAAEQFEVGPVSPTTNRRGLRIAQTSVIAVAKPKLFKSKARSPISAGFPALLASSDEEDMVPQALDNSGDLPGPRRSPIRRRGVKPNERRKATG